MSLLLEALKKAALEKRDRSQSKTSLAQSADAKLAQSARPLASASIAETEQAIHQCDSTDSHQVDESVDDQAGKVVASTDADQDREDWSETMDFTVLDEQVKSNGANSEKPEWDDPEDFLVQTSTSLEEAYLFNEIDANAKKSSELEREAQDADLRLEQPIPKHGQDKLVPNDYSDHAAPEPNTEATVTSADEQSQPKQVAPSKNPEGYNEETFSTAAHTVEQDLIAEVVADALSQTEELQEKQPKFDEKMSRQHTKDAMAQLIEKGNKREQMKRRRVMLACSLLVGLSITLAGFYYYFLNLNDSRAFVEVPVRSLELNDDVKPGKRAQGPEQSERVAEKEATSTKTDTADGAYPTLVDTKNAETKTDAKPLEPLESEPPENNTKPVTKAPVGERGKSGQKVSRPINRAAKIVSQDTDKDNIERAYAAYKNGEYGAALQLYRLAYRETPLNSDVLLGLAASSQKLGEEKAALTYYQQVLQDNPKNITAVAGLLSIKAGRAQKPELESELLNLISDYPGNAHLHFLLGNLYAANGNWSAAAHHYGISTKIENNNIEYLYNLAVTYDHLKMHDLALHYYLRVAKSPTKNSTKIPTQALRNRINTLSKTTSASLINNKRE